MKVISFPQMDNSQLDGAAHSVNLKYENSEALLIALSQTVIMQQAQIQALINMTAHILASVNDKETGVIEKAIDNDMLLFIRQVNKQFNDAITQAEEAIRTARAE